MPKPSSLSTRKKHGATSRSLAGAPSELGWGRLTLRASPEAPLRLPVFAAGAAGVWDREGRTITVLAGVLRVASLTVGRAEVNGGGPWVVPTGQVLAY